VGLSQQHQQQKARLANGAFMFHKEPAFVKAVFEVGQ
jgi:hypothetical protein